MKETVGKDAMGVIIKSKTLGAFCMPPWAIACARVIWLICMHRHAGAAGLSACISAGACISVKSRVHMLQLLCDTFVTIVATLLG